MAVSRYALEGTDRLVVYAIGPGFGESVIAVTPDGDIVVVDACTLDGRNLSATLLRDLGKSTIDLLLFSHPDTDHIRGGEELVANFSPKRVWAYPRAVSLRTFLAEVLQEDPYDDQADVLRALQKLLNSLESLNEDGILESVQSNTEPWISSKSQCRAYALAPTERDMSLASRQIRKIIQNGRKHPRLAARMSDFLRGRSSIAGDHPNLLSVALSIRWGKRKVILAGDVESGVHEQSGWRGVLSRLTRIGKTNRVSSVDVIKVAHHGSDNAFCDDAWLLHRQGRSDLAALICPFNKSGELPIAKALTKIRKHATSLAISAPSVEVRRRVRAAGWRTSSTCIVHSDWDLPLVAAVIPAVGPPVLHVSKQARGWIG